MRYRVMVKLLGRFLQVGPLVASPAVAHDTANALRAAGRNLEVLVQTVTRSQAQTMEGADVAG